MSIITYTREGKAAIFIINHPNKLGVLNLEVTLQ